MANIMDFLYGPLSQNWCMYFYVFSIFYSISFVISLVLFVRYIVGKNVNYNIAGSMFSYSIVAILAYIQMRILNGMCMNSSESPQVSTHSK